MSDLLQPTRVIRVTDDTTADELAECLTHLCKHAKRQQCIIGTLDQPSPWDTAHRRMDGPLDEYLAKVHARA